MSFYRKKPIIIEAIKWTGLNVEEVKQFCKDNAKLCINDSSWKVNVAAPKAELTIKTLEGDMKASIGDYIIKGINGEFYPCKPDIFEKTYEIVEENKNES